MSITPDDRRRAVGKIISVSADRFVVELHLGTDNFTIVGFDDVHYVARIGSLLIIPVQSEYVVAEVVGLREKDPNVNRPRRSDEGDLDKASSAKYLDLVPVGTLPQRRDGAFRFGVSTFPSLYADVLYMLDSELDRVFEVAESVERVKSEEDSPTRYKALSIGTSVIFQDYDVKVRVDEYFGGHVAVLGNTGSGKSCTVATIAQSLFEKTDEYPARGATFIFFDVNGEYRQAFSNLPNTISRLYLQVSEDPTVSAPATASNQEQTYTFRLPHWFMNVEEWELLLRASERTQQPVLRMALGLASLYSQDNDKKRDKIRNHILASCILYILQSDASSPSKRDRIIAQVSTHSTDVINIEAIREKVDLDYGSMQDTEDLTSFLKGCIVDNIELPNYEHTEFKFEDLEKALDLALLYEEAHGNRQIRDYCAQMLTRYKWIREREEFSFIRVSPDVLNETERQIDLFTENFLGLVRENNEYKKKAQIIILDMNEASDEVVEVAAAVMARLVFERMRKADPRNRMPINLVLEEAHRYIADRPTRYAIDASRIFERIAKEGRKYGVKWLPKTGQPES